MLETKRIEGMLGENRGVLTISADSTALVAAKKMRHHRVGSLVVVDDDGAPIGVVTERDLVDKVLANKADPGTIKLDEVMTAEVISITTKASILKAQALMARHKIRHLPVIEDGLLLGMISSRDIVAHQLGAVRTILQQQVRLCEDLEAYTTVAHD